MKYQDNVPSSPTTCDLMKRLTTSHAEIYMKKYCREKPSFTAGRKNVIYSTSVHVSPSMNLAEIYDLFQFWIWPSITLSIYLFDLIFRYFERFFTRVKVVSMELPTKNAMFLTFKVNDNIAIEPGQFVLLQCENLSTLEWHPFTLTDFVLEPKRTVFTLAISGESGREALPCKLICFLFSQFGVIGPANSTRRFPTLSCSRRRRRSGNRRIVVGRCHRLEN